MDTSIPPTLARRQANLASEATQSMTGGDGNTSRRSIAKDDKPASRGRMISLEQPTATARPPHTTIAIECARIMVDAHPEGRTALGQIQRETRGRQRKQSYSGDPVFGRHRRKTSVCQEGNAKAVAIQESQAELNQLRGRRVPGNWELGEYWLSCICPGYVPNMPWTRPGPGHAPNVPIFGFTELFMMDTGCACSWLSHESWSWKQFLVMCLGGTLYAINIFVVGVKNPPKM